jgi:hypothetical protein
MSNPGNSPPIANNASFYISPNNVLSESLVPYVSDPDGDPLSFLFDIPPSNGNLIMNPNGTFTYTPNANFVGIDSFTYLVNDDHMHTSNFATVTITIANAPCFSLQTLQKMLKNIDKNRNFIIVNSPRNNKKMYRCNIKNFGEVEFTHDHSFIYNDKIYTFENLLNIYPNVTNITEIPTNEISTVYNIIGHVDQINTENLFKINNDLFMIGGKFNFEITQKYFEKKLQIIKNLQQNKEYKELAEKKYFIKI